MPDIALSLGLQQEHGRHGHLPQRAYWDRQRVRREIQKHVGKVPDKRGLFRKRSICEQGRPRDELGLNVPGRGNCVRKV